MNRIKHALATLLFAAASLALGGAAQATNIVTYDFNQALGEGIQGSITGTLSLDLDAVADPAHITLAEFNALARYTLSVNHGSSTQFSDFVRTDADSLIKLTDPAQHRVVISATSTALKFARVPGFCLFCRR